MRFNRHSELEDKHATLGASRYHWIRYDMEKLERTYENLRKSQEGVELHELAKMLILKKIKLERNNLTLNSYVNDAIGYRMSPEVVLYVSDNAFGTADAISFDGNTLRIHDLKTGILKAHPEQLDIYAAYFCIEYRKNPYDLEIKLRIYKNDEILEFDGDPKEIQRIMKQTHEFSRRIDQMKAVIG